MDDLAKELGMSKKTLYAHFASKTALLEAVMLDKSRDVESDLERISSECSSNFLTAIHQLLPCMQQHLDEIRPPFLRDIQREAPEVFTLVEQRRKDLIYRFLGKLLDEGRSAGVIRDDISVEMVVEIFLGAIQAIVNPQKLLELGLSPKEGFSAIITVVSRRCDHRKREIQFMSGVTGTRRKALLGLCGVLTVVTIVTGCDTKNSNRVQGYVEGEFVYVASPLGGALESLHVQRGAHVKSGDPLFALDDTPEKAARDESSRRLSQARANLEDTKKGKRPTEIEAIEAQLRQARAALTFSEKEFERQEKLVSSGARAVQDFDRARSTRDQDSQRVAQLEADLETAQLGSRSDQIAAAEDNVRALEAALAKAEWDLSQKRQNAPQSGVVFDTLFREGEWVPAGRPVVVVLPPENIKVRAFVPQTRIGTIHRGDPVKVTVDGLQQPLMGKVSFISPRVEYTPPVIYSRESRDKLVFMVEAVFDPKTAANLHPGQPVDVQFGS